MQSTEKIICTLSDTATNVAPAITSMIRHFVARRAQVTEGHPHNALTGRTCPVVLPLTFAVLSAGRDVPAEMLHNCVKRLPSERTLLPRGERRPVRADCFRNVRDC
jgi:hypothetical protein